jgi:hypothetical protein
MKPGGTVGFLRIVEEDEEGEDGEWGLMDREDMLFM